MVIVRVTTSRLRLFRCRQPMRIADPARRFGFYPLARLVFRSHAGHILGAAVWPRYRDAKAKAYRILLDIEDGRAGVSAHRGTVAALHAGRHNAGPQRNDDDLVHYGTFCRSLSFYDVWRQ